MIFALDELDLGGLGFGWVEPDKTGRPSYHPSVLLMLYICTSAAISTGFYRTGGWNGESVASW